MKCQICNQEDSALTPILKVENAGKYEPIENVCANCVSTYDGMFAWTADGKVIYI